MKHTPSTIQKDPAKGVKKSAKNCVPKKVNSNDMKKQVTKKRHVPKDVEKSIKTKRVVETILKGEKSNETNCTIKIIPEDVKNSNGGATIRKDLVKREKRSTKKVIPKKPTEENMREVGLGTALFNKTEATSLKKSLETKSTKGRNEPGERRWKGQQNKTKFTKDINERRERRRERQQNKILKTMLKDLSSKLKRAVKEVSKLVEKP